jgi:hypothetical protein
MTFKPEIIGFMIKKSLTPRGVAYIRNRLFQAFLKNRGHLLAEPRFLKRNSMKKRTLGAAGNGGASRAWKGRGDGRDLVSKYLRKERILWMSAEEVS